jgi:hypothetical protein
MAVDMDHYACVWSIEIFHKKGVGTFYV